MGGTRVWKWVGPGSWGWGQGQGTQEGELEPPYFTSPDRTGPRCLRPGCHTSHPVVLGHFCLGSDTVTAAFTKHLDVEPKKLKSSFSTQ